jgi:ankyrin repeat protein
MSAHSPRSPSQFRYTPLIWAAFTGRAAAVKVLLATGASVNKASKVWPPFGRGCERQGPAIIATCVQTPSVPAQYRDTPLIDAAIQGHLTIVRLLLRSGAATGHTDVVRVLRVLLFSKIFQ